MAADARITRTVDTDLEVTELWSLVSDGEAWAQWLVDGADIEVDPGACGTVVDDGVARDVRIDRVEPSRQTGGAVTFTWWPQACPDQTSTVELVVVPVRTGSRLRVTETYAAVASASIATTLRWDVRAMLLVARASFVRA